MRGRGEPKRKPKGPKREKIKEKKPATLSDLLDGLQAGRPCLYRGRIKGAIV